MRDVYKLKVNEKCGEIDVSVGLVGISSDMIKIDVVLKSFVRGKKCYYGEISRYFKNELLD